MNDFSASFTTLANPIAPAESHKLLRFPPGCEHTVMQYSSNDRGGPVEATIKVRGPVAGLWLITNLLGERIYIHNPLGQLVWWGRLYEISLGMGKISVSASLGEMANRVAVVYSDYSPSEGYEQARTTWYDELDSQTQFGIKELLYSFGDSTASQADAKAQEILSNYGWPVGKTVFDSDEEATIICKGPMDFLSWKLYNDLFGHIRNPAVSGGNLSLGWSLTGNKFIFYQGNIFTNSGAFVGVENGDLLNITGSVSNNRQYTVTAIGSNTNLVRSANTISFDPSDDIMDSADGLGIFTGLNSIEVAGSASNSGTHLINSKVDDGHLTIYTALSRALVTAAAGPAITITQGRKVSTQETAVNEIAGASVTATLVGSMLIQSFTPVVTITASKLAVRACQVGNPVDNFIVKFYTDSAGVPGSQVGSTSITTGTALPADSPSEIWITLPTNITLTAGVTYWIHISRSGANASDKFYRLGLSESTYGLTKAWTGSAWQSFSRQGVPMSLPFTILDAEDTTTTMTRVIQAGGQSFVTSLAAAQTGVKATRYRNSDTTALVELQKLLDSGNSSGLRLIASVSPVGELTVEQQPSDSGPNPFLEEDGTISEISGARWTQGRLPVGKWLAIRGTPDSIASRWRLSPLYVESATYDAERDSMRLVPRGNRRVLDVFRRG